MCASLAPGAASRAQTREVTWLPGIVTLGTGEQAALDEALLLARAVDSTALRGNTQFAVTDYSCAIDAAGEVCFASLAGFQSLAMPADWKLEQAGTITLAVLTRAGTGWQAALQGAPAFDALALRSSRVRGVTRTLSESVPLNFPWQTQTKAVYGSLGVHSGGFVTGWKAVDLLSDGNSALGHAPNQMFTAGPGAISYVCDDGTSVAVRIGDLVYVHLIKNDGLRVGQAFDRGAPLGQMRTGNFNNRCGYASQASQNFHVHLAFPDTPTFVLGGWELTLADGIWRRGAQTWTTGQYVLNDGVQTLPPLPTPAATAPPAATPAPCAAASQAGGDANCDGVADGRDFSIWLRTQCAAACADRRADFNNDGAVDGSDFELWRISRALNAPPVANAAGAAGASASARLALTPAGALLGLGQEQTYSLTLILSPGIGPARVHYARVDLALPWQSVSLPAASAITIAPAGLGRLIAQNTVTYTNRSGVLSIEVGALSLADAPATTQTLTLARFQIAGKARGAGQTFDLLGAQIIDSNDYSLPVTYQPAMIGVDPGRTFVPIMRR